MDPELLEIIDKEMRLMGVDYHYIINNSDKITYPYVTGTYAELEARYEDGYHYGELTLDCWHRGSQLDLLKITEKIAKHFDDFRKVGRNITCHISCGNSSDIPTADASLKRREVKLECRYWKGE